MLTLVPELIPDRYLPNARPLARFPNFISKWGRGPKGRVQWFLIQSVEV